MRANKKLFDRTATCRAVIRANACVFVFVILCCAHVYWLDGSQARSTRADSSTPTIRRNSTRVWTTDLHAGPIGCEVSVFSSLRVDIAAHVDFPNCKHFHTKDGANLCAFGSTRGGLRRNGNFGYSLDPNPNDTRKRLYEHYAKDAQFVSSDVVFCSHPIANCEIYLPFDKSILLYGSTRLEFGRDDEYVWWRRPMMGRDSNERWKHWVRNLKAIAGSKSNFIAANNLYDVTYIEYLTGVETTHIPSWCGEDPDFMAHRIRYEPRRPEIVLTPYRLNLEYSREDIPETGWPNHHRRQKSRASPLRHKLFDDLHALIRSKAHDDAFNIIDMKQAFPRRGKFKSVHEFRNFRAVVLIPYQASTMFFFQLYRASVPMLVPSKRLMVEWVRDHRLLWEVSYGDPERVSDAMHSHLPSPNDFDAASREKWMDFYDVYQTDLFPHILYFDDWKHALEIVKTTNFKNVSEHMNRHNVNEFYRIRGVWRDVFATMASNRKQDDDNEFENINDALARRYNLQPLVFEHDSTRLRVPRIRWG